MAGMACGFAMLRTMPSRLVIAVGAPVASGQREKTEQQDGQKLDREVHEGIRLRHQGAARAGAEGVA